MNFKKKKVCRTNLLHPSETKKKCTWKAYFSAKDLVLDHWTRFCKNKCKRKEIWHQPIFQWKNLSYVTKAFQWNSHVSVILRNETNLDKVIFMQSCTQLLQYIHCTVVKGCLISESLSLWFHLSKYVPNHYPELFLSTWKSSR